MAGKVFSGTVRRATLGWLGNGEAGEVRSGKARPGVFGCGLMRQERLVAI